MEKTFDGTDHGILLTKLNIYGIKSKDPGLYQSYLNSRYFTTALHNDSGQG